MESISLSSGREITIQHIDIENTWADVLEGLPEMVAKFQRRRIRDIIKDRFHRFRETDAIVILDDQQPTLPKYRCIARLRSEPLERGNVYSTLIVCWFTDDIGVNLLEATKQIMETVDWAAHAEDATVLELYG